MKTITEPAKEIPIAAEVDVLVAGAGMAGIAAAIAAARNGAETLLVERNGVLGGVAVAGMTLSWANLYFTPEETLAKGIGMELAERLVERGGTGARWRDNFTITLDPEIYQLVVLEMFEEAGVKLLTHSIVADAIMAGDTLGGVIVENKSGRQALLSKVTIDATGDADVAAQAGAPYEDQPQGSATLCFRMANIDLERFFQFLKEHPDELVPWETGSERFDIDSIERIWRETGFINLQDNYPLKGTRQKAIEAGDFSDQFGSCGLLGRMAISGTGWNGTAIINTGSFHINNLDQFALTSAEIDGRKAAFYVAGFFNKYLPGFENAFIVSIASDLGVRITRRVIGEYVYTFDDAERRTQFPDVIGKTHGRRLRVGEPGLEIPYRILVPKTADNLLMGSGKSVSGDLKSVQQPLRNMISGLVIGEAAGTAAALAAKAGVTPRALDVKLLQHTLLQQGAYLGTEARLRELGLS
jgi:hypothetical protein